MMRRHLFLVPALTAVICACAITPQSVHFTPDVAVAPSAVGAGHVISLRVTDGRDSPALGYRGNGANGARISSSDDLPEVIRLALTSGLEQQGFVLAENRADVPLLAI